MVHVTLTAPSLKDNSADVDRLIRGIKKEIKTEGVEVNLALARRIPALLREFGYEFKALLCRDRNSWRLTALYPPGEDHDIYGLSVDLGTSTVVMRLLDLRDQRIVDETSFLNPQLPLGADVLTRIHYATQGGGLEQLQSILSDGINREISRLKGKHKIGRDSITGMSVAGNTTMTHLFLGMDPYWICREPYIPVVNSPGPLRASDLGLEIHPDSPVLVLPGAGSYLGGDIIAGILASGMHRQDNICALLDVGTNAELVLGNRDWLIACAGAAGPALEGGVASMGMMAGPGAIDRVIIDPVTGDFQIRTIEDRPAVGICGSGLIDMVAQLFLSGMIDMLGKFVAEKCRERLEEIDGIKHLVFVPSTDSGTHQDLTLSQTDIDALLRSKAAMYTILTTVTRMVNISVMDIERFFIAGTFGAYIDPGSAITLGMIPDLPLETYRPLGNSSLEGASLALLSLEARDELYRIRDRITYVELNVNQEFMNNFSAARCIPHTDRSLFPSVP